MPPPDARPSRVRVDPFVRWERSLTPFAALYCRYPVAAIAWISIWYPLRRSFTGMTARAGL